MANTQSKNDSLEQISKLIAENTEIKKKYAEVEAENAKLKEIIKQSTRRGAEYEARIRKLEQSDKEKAGLKSKFEALERKNKMDTANLTVENIKLKPG
ncbi:12999_t:CDS:1, partial [Entrophospora sp. SA101]